MAQVREKDEPIICETWHDEGHLEPVASNVEGVMRLRALKGYFDDEDEYSDAEEIARKLGISLPKSQELPESQESEDEISVEAELEADPHSPAVLLRAAKESMQRGDLNKAEASLLRATALLPEYTDALHALAQLYRRQKTWQKLPVTC